MDSCCRSDEFIFGLFQLSFNTIPDGLCKLEDLKT